VWRRPGPADGALLAAVLIAGSVERHAVYTWYGVLILLGCVAALFAAALRGAGRAVPAPWAVTLAVTAAAWFQLVKPPWMNVVSTWLLAAGAWTAGAATLGVLAVLAAPPRRRRPAALAVLAATGVAYALVVRGSLRPLIDVWAILQGAALGAVHGANPYQMTFDGVPPGQVDDCFNYLPVTFLAPVPSRLLLGDVRYAEAAVLLAGVAAVLWRAARAARTGQPAARTGQPAAVTAGRSAAVALPLALLLGVLPGSLYEVQQAWNEAILAGALVGAAVLADRGRRWPAVGCVALALATKQHVVLLLPLLACWPAFGVRRAVAAAAGGAAVCLPWYVWDPHRFTHCTVDFFLDLPARPDSLSLWRWLPTGLGTPLLLLAAVAAYAVALRRLPRDGAGLLLGWALILAAWDLLNKQSFMNQWLLVAQLTVAGLALSASRQPTATDPSSLGRLTTNPSAD
jgi:hypothetical protein